MKAILPGFRFEVQGSRFLFLQRLFTPADVGVLAPADLRKKSHSSSQKGLQGKSAKQAHEPKKVWGLRFRVLDLHTQNFLMFSPPNQEWCRRGLDSRLVCTPCENMMIESGFAEVARHSAGALLVGAFIDKPAV